MPLSPPTRSFSLWICRRCVRSLSSTSRPASAKLWEDAAREESEEPTTSPRSPETLPDCQDEPWTGEESTRDAVLRMLVDKYKPLRSGHIRSADEKLHSMPPTPTASYVPQESSNIKPWMVTFTPPKLTPSIRLAKILKSQPSSSNPADQSALDFRELKRLRRVKEIDRLTMAREKTLDYRMGRASPHSQGGNPVSMRGWANVVEDRIERARAAGHFKNLKGRGKPMITTVEETNPFIAREEYLMNRIVQRNEAAPPWVEMQAELQSTISSFRRTLQEAWVRRAVRMIGLRQNVPTELTESTLNKMRDREWETRERSFHELCLKEVNSLMRKYNNAAPYAVRKAYLELEQELLQTYGSSGGAIMEELAVRKDQRGRGQQLRDADGWEANIEEGGLFRRVIAAFRRIVLGAERSV